MSANATKYNQMTSWTLIWKMGLPYYGQIFGHLADKYFKQQLSMDFSTQSNKQKRFLCTNVLQRFEY